MLTPCLLDVIQVRVVGGRVNDVQTNYGDTNAHEVLRSTEGPGSPGPSDIRTYL
jgi:hypothetical protein